MTQATLNAKLDDFINRRKGQQIAYNGGFKGECLSLVKQYMTEVFGFAAPASGTGTAIGYYSRFPAPLGNYFTKRAFSPNFNPPKGSVVVYGANPGNPAGHIAIIVGSQTDIFDQNSPKGTPAGIHKRGLRTDIGWLIPILQTPHPPSDWVGRILFLKPYVSSWNVYPVGSMPPRTPVAKLNPKKYGGLSYAILAMDKAPRSVVIQTQMFGRVSIYVDGDAEIR